MKRHAAIAFLLLALAASGRAQQPRSIDNPVLSGAADVGVMRYNGEYYLMGVGTSGDMYVSSDLVHWRGPEHAFSMQNDWTPGPAAEDRRIHANDFEYVNGTFHLYWSVNYWGEPQMTVHIGHATSNDATGPYREPVTATWFDDRIDPHLFVDDDGTPYFYSVKFSDGNVIYGQKMTDPWTLTGTPRSLLSALPRTWETRSAHRVNEGAEVDKYRDRYYMLYAANHVSARWGQYAIGVAEAEHPLGFNNASKYDYPVMEPSNEARITTDADVFVPIGKGSWQYTTTPPSETDWNAVDYDDSSWQQGEAAFGNRTVENSTTNRVHTPWEAPEIWLRKTFRLEEQPSEHTQLLMRLRGTADVYVNGERIYHTDGVQNYATIDLEDVSAFRQGENVLSVHAGREEGRRYIDVGLLDPRTRPGEAYIFSPGQPNLVRGPNGFEWWVVYFGRFNASGKSQAVDRAHFFDRTLHVDGPTGPRTPGYHPPPHPPTFGDLFNENDRRELGTPWQTDGGRWQVRSGEAVQLDKASEAYASISEPGGTHYLFQTGLRFLDDTGKEAGIVAYEGDAGNRLVVGLDRRKKAWTYRLMQNGERVDRSFALPDSFRYGAYHTLRVTKNAGTFSIALDDRLAPGTATIETELVGSGRPALYTRDARAAFDGVAYTRGWDEFDAYITGWTPPSLSGSDVWRVDSAGLHQAALRGEHCLVKGDPLTAYEFSTQVYGFAPSGDVRQGRMGFLPVYVDENNWLSAEIDVAGGRLIVERMKDGAQDERWAVDLARTKRLYPNATHSDRFAKRYTFQSPTLIDELRVARGGHGAGARLPEDVRATFRRNDIWKPLPRGASFAPIVVDALRLEVGDEGEPLEAVSARVLGRSTYNLRAVKLLGEVILFVDGREVLRVPGRWPPSQVGLVTRDAKATYNGITRFGIPAAVE